MTKTRSETPYIEIILLNKEDIVMIDRKELEDITGSVITPFEGEEIPMVRIATQEEKDEYDSEYDSEFDVDFEMDFDLDEKDPKETIH